MRIFIRATLSVLLLSLLAGQAEAHAILVKANPDREASLAEAPNEVLTTP